MDDLLRYLEQTEGPTGYLILGLTALIEYVFPPFPGDAAALVGVVLAVGSGYAVVGVYLALTLGSVIGGAATWAFGRWLAGARDRWPRWMKGARMSAALASVERGFERHGAIYLSVNRFLPALRAFFFVGAGLSGMRFFPMLLFGAISAALWNALILAVGYELGANLDALSAWLQKYSIAALVVVLVIGIAFFMRSARRGP